MLLHSFVGVASSEVPVENAFYPPSAQRAYNTHSVCSCWTKWTEEYLKAYHWYGITQNSFCLCYAHLSRSWSTFGMAGWSFCQGRIGRDCVQPFSMFFLHVSGRFCEAEKQLSNSLERGNCFLVMGWIDIRFAAVLFISRGCPLHGHTEAESGVSVTEMHHLILALIRHISMWLRMFTRLFKLAQNCPSKVTEGGFSLSNMLFEGYLLPSCLSASEHCLPPDAVKRKEHILQNWQGLFFLLSELFVKQLFFCDNSLNFNNVHIFFLCQKLSLCIVKVKCR